MVVRLGRRLAVESGFASGEKTFQAYMVKGFVYVLICSDGRLYIGSTRDLDNRIDAHRNGRVKTTKSRRPIILVYTEELPTYTDARKRESYLKSGTGRDWIKKKLEGWLSGRKRRS